MVVFNYPMTEQADAGFGHWTFTGHWASRHWSLSHRWPNGHEVIPLIQVQPDGRLDGAHDALRQFETCGSISERRSIIGNLRQDMSRIATRGARQIHRQDRAT